jgi:hypothetical protein
MVFYRLGSSSWWYFSDSVTSVAINITGYALGGTGCLAYGFQTAGGYFDAGLTSNSYSYDCWTSSVPRTITTTFYTNPFTGLPWTKSDVQANFKGFFADADYSQYPATGYKTPPSNDQGVTNVVQKFTITINITTH